MFNLVAHFQRLFCRFRKRVLVNNKNKLQAKLDNYIRILCTYNVHFYNLCIDFCSRLLLLPSLKALKSIHVWEATIKNVAIWSLYYRQRTLYQTPEHVGKMLISTIKSVQFAFKVWFSRWSPLPPRKISKFCTESL